MPHHNRNNSQSVTAQPSSSSQKIRFSFEYYDDRESNCYCISSWSKEQIKKTLNRLKDISLKSYNDLMQGGRVLHFGEVDWSKTTERGGFPFPAVNNLQPFHFALLGVNGQMARVYGAYSQGTFYIVWFDLNHEIWPTPLRHT